MPQRSILLRNTMSFNRAHADEFKQAIRNAVEFAKAHAPQLMVQVFIDEEQALCYSFQLYENSEAILRHWEVSDPHISAVMAHCSVRRMEVYGTPSDEVRSGILRSVSEDRVSFTPAITGYHHLAAP